MAYFMQEYTYEKLKNFQRVKSLREIFHSGSKKKILEDETIVKIKENINNYKKKEQIRLKKIEALTQLLDKIEKKVIHNKFRNINRY
jgi:hypothetical protein